MPPQRQRIVQMDPDDFLDMVESGRALPSFATLLTNFCVLYMYLDAAPFYVMCTSSGTRITHDDLVDWVQGGREPDADMQAKLLHGFVSDLRRRISDCRAVGKKIPTFPRTVAAIPVGTFRDPLGAASIGGGPGPTSDRPPTREESDASVKTLPVVTVGSPKIDLGRIDEI